MKQAILLLIILALNLATVIAHEGEPDEKHRAESLDELLNQEPTNRAGQAISFFIVVLGVPVVLTWWNYYHRLNEAAKRQ